MGLCGGDPHGGPLDYLEQLLSEWYEYQGYFVRRDLWVGLELDGSYEAELNVVAFNPVKNHVVHLSRAWTASIGRNASSTSA